MGRTFVLSLFNQKKVSSNKQEQGFERHIKTFQPKICSLIETIFSIQSVFLWMKWTFLESMLFFFFKVILTQTCSSLAHFALLVVLSLKLIWPMGKQTPTAGRLRQKDIFWLENFFQFIQIFQKFLNLDYIFDLKHVLSLIHAALFWLIDNTWIK